MFARSDFSPEEPGLWGRQGEFRDKSASAQFRVRMVSRSSGLRSVGLFPPAAAMSACTAASQAKVSRAAGT